MKVYVVKHYWKDGENATWESHPKVDKEIFEYLKKNYHNFVKDRPLMIKEDKYIYFCYEEKKDIYNRNITDITFFVSEYKIDEKLCNKKDSNTLELELATPQESQINPFLIRSLIGLVAIVGILLFWFYNSNEQKSLENKDKNMTNLSKTEKINSEKEEINIKVNKELRDINLSIKDINLTFITDKIKIINEKIEGKEKLLNDENNCSLNKLRDFVIINKKIQDLNTHIKNKEEIGKCKKDFDEIQTEYKDKDFNNIYTQNSITQSRESLNRYRNSLVEKKN